MSSEDADDERETPADTPIPWIDSRHLTFTIFVVLPNDNVCTLRDVPSGISVFDLKVWYSMKSDRIKNVFRVTRPYLSLLVEA